MNYQEENLTNIKKKLSEKFSNSFLSKLDDVIVFDYLSKEALKKISQNYLFECGEETIPEEEILMGKDQEYHQFNAHLIEKDCKNYLLKKINQKIKES